MFNTRAWPVRAMYMLVAAALVMSLIIIAVPSETVTAASPLISHWDMVSTPSMEDWVLAPNSEIEDYAVADEGRVAYAIVDGFNQREGAHGVWLLKSTDHAATWRDITSGLKKEITNRNLDVDYDCAWIDKVATAPDDHDFVAVALWLGDACDELHVFISKDGGTKFRNTGSVALEEVYDFAISPVGRDDWRDMAIGGEAADGRNLWRSRAREGDDMATGWVDATAYQGWDDGIVARNSIVVAIQFPQTWDKDMTVLAATVNQARTAVHLQSGTWGTDVVEAWNDEAGFADAVVIVENVDIPELWGLEAGITLPTDYEGRFSTKRFAWVWVNYRDTSVWPSVPVGEIYVVDNDHAQAVREQIRNRPWLTNVSYWGTIASGKAIAGLLGTGMDNGLYTERCEGVQVYHYDVVGPNMDICCPAWKPACKPPTGSLAMEAFYVTADKAYAVALWDDTEFGEGAWSFSFDDGYNWNQLSLIDTWISYLSDVAVSPNCNKTMAVSINYGPDFDRDDLCDSVWYRADNQTHAPEYSGKWLRTWSRQFEGAHPWPHVLRWGMLRLAPEEIDGETVYLVDVGTNKLFYNDMQTLACWEPGRSTIDEIIDLAVTDASTIYALGLDGYVAMSDDYGAAPSWSEPVDTEINAGWSIAVWGDDILVGGQYDNWNYSDDGGETWGDDPERGPHGYYVTVAFDSYYDANNMIYAAVGAEVWDSIASEEVTTGGIYRRILHEDEDWTDLRAEPNYFYTGLVLDNADGNPMTSPATGGVLYASYHEYFYEYTVVDDQLVSIHHRGTGVARLLKPADDFCCDDTDWDYLNVARHKYRHIFANSSFWMAPRALKICGCLTADSNTKLFAIGLDVWGPYTNYDMARGEGGTVWMFEDCFSKSAPNLRNPADGTLVADDGCCEILPILMEWSRLCDACNYQIEIALDSGFTQGVIRFPESSWWYDEIRPTPATAPSWMFRDTWALSAGTTYYWRIRSLVAETDQVIRSWWSAPRSFTTGLFAETGVTLTSPEPGATNVPRTNIAFSWSMTAQADSYNWVLSPNADLSGPVDQATGLTSAGYKFTGTLSADTSYYWRVTSIKDGSATSMAMGTFTTSAAAVYCSPQSGLCFNTEAELKAHHEQLQKDALKTPTWVWVVIAIGAVLVIVVIVLIFRTRRV